MISCESRIICFENAISGPEDRGSRNLLRGPVLETGRRQWAAMGYHAQ